MRFGNFMRRIRANQEGARRLFAASQELRLEKGGGSVTKLAGVGVGDGVVSTGLGLVTEKGSARRLVSEAAVLDIYRRARVQLNSLPSLV
jgi:hypothetical protein